MPEPEEVKQAPSIQFPMDLYDSFSGLLERGLMTPTYLSRLLLLSLVLPAAGEKKKTPIENNMLGCCTERSLFDRGYLSLSSSEDHEKWYHWFPSAIKKFNTQYTIRSLSVKGLETIQVIPQEGRAQQYEIFFRGNQDDAMRADIIFWLTRDVSSKKNYIFWNYPGVGCSEGEVRSPNDLFKAAYSQVKRLIDEDVSAKNITLSGFSLGGGVAANAARQCHEEGYFVNLKIDRSFSSLAAVASTHCDQRLSSLVVGPAIVGVALGTICAGFLSSVGLVAANAVAVIGYMAACFLQVVGSLLKEITLFIGEMLAFTFSVSLPSVSEDIQSLFNTMGCFLAYFFCSSAFVLNVIANAIARSMDHAVNGMGSVIGGVVAIAGLLSGIIVGLLLYALVSIRLLWTNEPLTLKSPMFSLFSVVLYSLCCEMDSVNELHRLVNAHPHLQDEDENSVNIKVINVKDDLIIPPDASLCAGVGFKLETASGKLESKNNLLSKIHGFWHYGEFRRPKKTDILNNQEINYAHNGALCAIISECNNGEVTYHQPSPV